MTDVFYVKEVEPRGQGKKQNVFMLCARGFTDSTARTRCDVVITVTTGSPARAVRQDLQRFCDALNGAVYARRHGRTTAAEYACDQARSEDSRQAQVERMLRENK